MASFVDPETGPLSSSRISSCDEPPVLLQGESCISVGDVSSLPPSPPFAALLMHLRHCLPWQLACVRTGATPALLPRLRVGLPVLLAEAWDPQPHQVPHGRCCASGQVHDCTGSCTEASWVGDDLCHAELECYCEEEESDCGEPPVPVCSARWVSRQHPHEGADEPLQGREVMLGADGVLCKT